MPTRIWHCDQNSCFLIFETLKRMSIPTGADFPLTKRIALFGAPILCLLMLNFSPFLMLSPMAQKVLAVMAWMLIWWIGEVVHLSVTALLPIVLFPLLGIMKVEVVTQSYGNSVIFLFLGGFMIALAMEKWNLHIRIALNIVKATGTNADSIILGFMFATGFLSLWISNTATTVMMLPIAASVIGLLGEAKADPKSLANFNLCLLLGIAYAATIGGCGTIIGTPPNQVFASIIAKLYGYEVSFAQWAMFGIPFVTLLLLLNYWVMVKWVYPNRLGYFEGTAKVIESELQKIGKMSKAEKLTMSVFVLTACLWIFRDVLNHLFVIAHLSLKLDDTMIAVFAAILLFLIPVNFKQGEFLLQWEDTKRLPWGILLLFGGGLSLSSALDRSGIIQLIGDSVGNHKDWNMLTVISLMVIVGVFMSEVMSNVAMVAVMTPVVAGLAIGLGQDPLLLTIPVTLAASCAFMLPMGTPPNAIVFASGHIKFFQMVKVGFILNIIGIILMIAVAWYILPWVFGIELGVVPEWAK